MARQPDPRHVALEALRDSLRTSLNVKARDVGGWELVDNRALTIKVYLTGGSYGHKPGGQLTSTDQVVIVANLQSGTPLYEDELYPLGDALAVLVGRFTHPNVAGARATSWKVDILEDKTYDNIVTVNGEITFRSREHYGPGEQTLGRAIAVLARVTQQEDHP